MKRIYFDHAAATPVAPEVVLAMTPFWGEIFGNPSSIHKEGVAAKQALESARKTFALELGVHTDEIIFTGSATESCNLALSGTVNAWKEDHPGRTPHLIVSAIEHDAVLSSARALEKGGALLTLLPVDRYGVVDLDLLESALTLDSVIISIAYANNEVGVIQPFREITHRVRHWKKTVRGISRDVHPKGDDRYPLVHTDACQATNYCEISIPKLGVDLLTINAAKIYGPKGVALLTVLRDTPLSPTIIGGGQERERRAGTENVPLIAGFAEALRIVARQRESETLRLALLRDDMITQLQQIDGVTINGSTTSRLPNNIHFSLRGADHEYLALALDARGIAVATKSACNEAEAESSHVLRALLVAGHDGEASGIRVTLGQGSTKSEIDTFLQILEEVKRSAIVTFL